MKILIYGSKGWNGKHVTEYLDTQNITYTEGTVRVDNIEELELEITKFIPTHVISLIGRTHGKIGDKFIETIAKIRMKHPDIYDKNKEHIFKGNY